ncbi:MAG: metallophosphoesterase [Alistipes sp.]|nr:metallophosphoesterase [Alistipes sp.]
MLTRLSKLFLLLTFLAIATVSFAQKRAPFFVQISDPQLGFITNTQDFSAEVELMKRITEKVNNLQPDFVVFSGDLVNWWDNAGMLEGFKKMRGEFDKKIPLYYVPGNHDVENDAPAENVAAFIDRYGHDRFVYKAKDYTVIGYNSCVIKAATAAEADEYAWIEKVLKRARKNKPIILVAHHPMFLSDPNEAERYENIGVELRKKYLALFEQYGVDLVLSGHLHYCAQGQYKDIKFVTAGPAGRPFGQTKSGVEIITIKSGVAEATYYAVDDIPQSIE